MEFYSRLVNLDAAALRATALRVFSSVVSTLLAPAATVLLVAASLAIYMVVSGSHLTGLAFLGTLAGTFTSVLFVEGVRANLALRSAPEAKVAEAK